MSQRTGSVPYPQSGSPLCPEGGVLSPLVPRGWDPSRDSSRWGSIFPPPRVHSTQPAQTVGSHLAVAQGVGLGTGFGKELPRLGGSGGLAVEKVFAGGGGQRLAPKVPSPSWCPALEGPPIPSMFPLLQSPGTRGGGLHVRGAPGEEGAAPAVHTGHLDPVPQCGHPTPDRSLGPLTPRMGWPCLDDFSCSRCFQSRLICTPVWRPTPYPLSSAGLGRLPAPGQRRPGPSLRALLPSRPAAGQDADPRLAPTRPHCGPRALCSLSGTPAPTLLGLGLPTRVVGGLPGQRHLLGEEGVARATPTASPCAKGRGGAQPKEDLEHSAPRKPPGDRDPGLQDDGLSGWGGEGKEGRRHTWEPGARSQQRGPALAPAPRPPAAPTPRP